MTTVSCPKCNKKFHKPLKHTADLALRMHMGRMHGPIQFKGGKRKAPGAPKETGTRRKYTRRTQAGHQHGELQANFCPGCGLNLGLLAVAMSVATKVKNGK